MKPYRIVLADDHALMRAGIKQLVDGQPGLNVTGEAANGTELLRILRQDTPDLVILDISMPGLGGIEVARTIQDRHPDVAVLILSMHKRKEYLRMALAAGAKGYLLKENTAGELIRAIQTVLKLIAEGHTNQQIGELLFISPRTVHRHRSNIREKLQLKRTADLVVYAIRKGLISPES